MSIVGSGMLLHLYRYVAHGWICMRLAVGIQTGMHLQFVCGVHGWAAYLSAGLKAGVQYRYTAMSRYACLKVNGCAVQKASHMQ